MSVTAKIESGVANKIPIESMLHIFPQPDIAATAIDGRIMSTDMLILTS